VSQSPHAFFRSEPIDTALTTPTRGGVEVAGLSGATTQKVLVVLGSVSIAAISVLQRIDKLSLHDAFVLNLGALASVGLLAALVSSGPLLPRRLIENRTQLAVFLGIAVLGLGMRTWLFSEFPPRRGQLLEEPQTGAIAYQSITSDGLDVVFPLPNLLAEAGLRLFGFTLEALRLPFLIWGVLSVVVFFVASRLFFRTFFAASAAATLFAGCAFLAGSSRIAIETMSPITTATIALAAVFYCCTRTSGLSFFVAGFGIGLLFLESVGFKLVAGMLLVFLVAFFSQRRTPEACNVSEGGYAIGNLWRHKWRFVLLLLTIVAIYLPLIVSGAESVTTSFLENIIRHRVGVEEEAAGRSWTAVLESQLPKAKATLPFVFGGSGDAGHDILPSSRGLVDEASGVVGVVALFFCLVTARRNPARGFLVLTVVAAVVLSGVMVVNPSRYRLVPIIPLYLLAVGVLVEAALFMWPDRRRLVVGCWTAGLLLAVAFNVHIFFGEAVHDPDVQRYFGDFELVMAQEIAELQREFPDQRTLVVSRFDFLEVPNDFSFLYDPDRVDVISSIDELTEHGDGLRPRYHSLVAHDDLIPTLTEIPRVGQCRTEDFSGAVYREHRLVVCTLN
jgi:4-amino-4-deoxy-L-arabinose transferase-like glycosyltransferase